jgi:outer membrane protein assembly factor BamB
MLRRIGGEGVGRHLHGLLRRIAGIALAVHVVDALPAAAAFTVWTQHYDNLRTGWNSSESTLNVTNVRGGSFHLVASTAVDDQVDAQPLIIPSQPIAGQGIHDVAYVVTENDSVYAIDANTGAILVQTNFGKPVLRKSLPGWCPNNGPEIGINSTPVIDFWTRTLYVMSLTVENGSPIYRLHALALTNLQDRVPSIVVSASTTLSDETLFSFHPEAQRQRSALLLANGNVYAGFASFCDGNANISRGWVLGWQESSLAPLPSNNVTNRLASAPHNFYLSSVWMSGNGLAANAAGNIYFSTGNSDPSGTTYNKKTNLSESVVELLPDLSAVVNHFTMPTVSLLDQRDEDFGSGGVMLLPPTGTTRNLAVAAGKSGTMRVLDADDLGIQYGAFALAGQCWCAPSYFQGRDGYARIVTSGGSVAQIWLVESTPRITLSLQRETGKVANGQDGGFFTSVSSNGKEPGTVILWAVGRPTNNNPAHVDLYAFSASGKLLYSAVAGSWPNTTANANIVPVVANGKVYVAANGSLAIFGLGSRSGARLPPPAAVNALSQLAVGEHEIFAKVVAIDDQDMTVRTRDGKLLTINSSLAEKNMLMASPSVNHAVIIRGHFDRNGTLIASSILHAKDNSALWWPDR